MSTVGLMSHTQCDSSASPGDSRVLSQLGLCHYSSPRACVFKHWQELNPTAPFPLKGAEIDSSLWWTGASTNTFGEWIKCLKTKSPIPMRSSCVVPRTWTRGVHNPPSLNCHLGNLKVKTFFSYLYYFISSGILAEFSKLKMKTELQICDPLCS